MNLNGCVPVGTGTGTGIHCRIVSVFLVSCKYICVVLVVCTHTIVGITMTIVAGNTYGRIVNINALVLSHNTCVSIGVLQSHIRNIDNEHFLVITGLDSDGYALAFLTLHETYSCQCCINCSIITAGSTNSDSLLVRYSVGCCSAQHGDSLINSCAIYLNIGGNLLSIAIKYSSHCVLAVSQCNTGSAGKAVYITFLIDVGEGQCNVCSLFYAGTIQSHINSIYRLLGKLQIYYCIILGCRSSLGIQSIIIYASLRNSVSHTFLELSGISLVCCINCSSGNINLLTGESKLKVCCIFSSQICQGTTYLK